MSDTNPTDALGLHPAEPLGPSPPDADTVRRSLEARDAFMANNYSEHDPTSICYRRPDLAQRYRADYMAKFQATMVRHGATMPVPETTEAIEARQFAERWPENAIPEAFVAEITTRTEAAKALTKDQREKAIADMQRDLGTRRWGQLENTIAMPHGVTKAEFIRTEGARQHAELVRLAQASGKYSEALAGDGYALNRLAGYGKYQLARNAAKRG